MLTVQGLISPPRWERKGGWDNLVYDSGNWLYVCLHPVLVDQMVGTDCMCVYIVTWWIRWWELAVCVFTSYPGASDGGNWVYVCSHPHVSGIGTGQMCVYFPVDQIRTKMSYNTGGPLLVTYFLPAGPYFPSFTAS